MSPRLLWIALAVSLAVNIFVVGVFAGALGSRARVAPPPGGQGGNPLMAAADELPEGLRGAYRERIRAESLAARPQLLAAREARLEAARILAQPDYDPEAAADALRRARDAELAARARLEEVVIDFAGDMEPGQRRVLARGLRQPPGAARGRAGNRRPGAMQPQGGPPPFAPPPEAPPQ